MSTKPEKEELHEIAGGWITERKGTPIPMFLKLAYVGFCAFGLYYMVVYWTGETTHPTRGALVTQFNSVLQAPAGWWHIVLVAILVTFVAGLLWFAFVSKDEE
jgi:uncharacterized membrane protein (DUF106 family)